MNARHACVSPISDIRYEKPTSDTIPISDMKNPHPIVNINLLMKIFYII